MAMTDPLADMLTRLRNAGLARHASVSLPSSKLKVAVATVLKDAGYIKNFKVLTDDKQGVLKLYLSYDEGKQHIIHEVKRVSKPGCRVYVGKDEIPVVKNGFGVAILSTSRGVMDDKSARDAQVGGEVLCTVW